MACWPVSPGSEARARQVASSRSTRGSLANGRSLRHTARCSGAPPALVTWASSCSSDSAGAAGRLQAWRRVARRSGCRRRRLEARSGSDGAAAALGWRNGPLGCRRRLARVAGRPARVPQPRPPGGRRVGAPGGGLGGSGAGSSTSITRSSSVADCAGTGGAAGRAPDRSPPAACPQPCGPASRLRPPRAGPGSRHPACPAGRRGARAAAGRAAWPTGPPGAPAAARNSAPGGRVPRPSWSRGRRRPPGASTISRRPASFAQRLGATVAGTPAASSSASDGRIRPAGAAIRAAATGSPLASDSALASRGSSISPSSRMAVSRVPPYSRWRWRARCNWRWSSSSRRISQPASVSASRAAAAGGAAGAVRMAPPGSTAW